MRIRPFVIKFFIAVAVFMAPIHLTRSNLSAKASVKTDTSCPRLKSSN
jgi:hypothetical protein